MPPSSPATAAAPETASAHAAPVVLKNPRGGDVVTVGDGGVTLMGVINRSAESNCPYTYAPDVATAMDMARAYRKVGVEVIDVGGQSTNFRKRRTSPEEEMERLVPTVEALANEGFVVSADTFRPEVAAAALDAGTALLNDTAGFNDPDMVTLAAKTRIPVVLMYLDGAHPYAVTDYDDSPGRTGRIAVHLKQRLAELAAAGIDQAIVDPGSSINYHMTDEQLARSNFDIAASLAPLVALRAPVMYAVSRWREPYWNVAQAAIAMTTGAAMLRIHDVREIAEVAWLMRQLPRPPEGFRM